MFDRDAATTEILARLASQVPEIVYRDTAENLDEEILRTCNTPATFVLIRIPSGLELVPGVKKQKQELEIVVGIVQQSVAQGRSGALKGAKSLQTLGGKVMRALHWWQPTWALEKVKFRGEEPPIRQGTRMGLEQKYSASIQETFS
jgi:hypothetical protein